MSDTTDTPTDYAAIRAVGGLTGRAECYTRVVARVAALSRWLDTHPGIAVTSVSADCFDSLTERYPTVHLDAADFDRLLGDVSRWRVTRRRNGSTSDRWSVIDNGVEVFCLVDVPATAVTP